MSDNPRAALQILLDEAQAQLALMETLLADMQADVRQIIPSRRRARARAYGTIRREHREAIRDAVAGFLGSNLPATKFRNAAGRAIAEHYSEAFYLGYRQASGAEKVAADDDQWLTDQINAGIGYVDQLFDALRGIRKAGDYDAEAIAKEHAGAYAGTLDSVYGQGKLFGNTNVMLTFDGPDGKENCSECRRYKGQRHRARWWIERDLVRRNGNENFTCGRWGPCRHHLFTDDGKLYAA